MPLIPQDAAHPVATDEKPPEEKPWQLYIVPPAAGREHAGSFPDAQRASADKDFIVARMPKGTGHIIVKEPRDLTAPTFNSARMKESTPDHDGSDS